MSATDPADWAHEQMRRTEWENEQMAEARLDKATAAAVRRVLEAWWAGTGSQGIKVDVAVDSFVKLARGEALVPKVDETAVWDQLKPGRVHVRDDVRVRLGAYEGDAGRAHNGRWGRVVAVRYGDVVVRYEDGRQPVFEAVHHSPDKLERRVKS